MNVLTDVAVRPLFETAAADRIALQFAVARLAGIIFEMNPASGALLKEMLEGMMDVSNRAEDDKLRDAFKNLADDISEQILLRMAA